MEVQINRDVFLKGLQLVQNIVEPRQTLPILANVLLETEGELIRIAATDLEVGARVGIPGQVVTSGAITLSARKLLEIVKELPSSPMAIKVQENSWVALRCAGVGYKLVGLPPEDFPVVQAVDLEEWVGVEAAVLRVMLAETSFAISHDESRHALNGVFFSIRPKEIRLVATDGHRLALAQRPLDNVGPGGSGIVPRKAVHEIARVLGAGESVQVALSGSQFALRMPNFLLTSRLIEGQFPNYEQVLPKGHPIRLTLLKEAVMAVLRRVSVLSEERTKHVKIFLSPGFLKFTAYTPELGEAEETIPVEYSGGEVAIGFNSRYLLDALSPIEGDQVVMELKDGASPGVFRNVEGDDYVCVIMPMRI
jgi:DNA polymerase-3 subunit beta